MLPVGLDTLYVSWCTRILFMTTQCLFVYFLSLQANSVAYCICPTDGTSDAFTFTFSRLWSCRLQVTLGLHFVCVCRRMKICLLKNRILTSTAKVSVVIVSNLCSKLTVEFCCMSVCLLGYTTMSPHSQPGRNSSRWHVIHYRPTVSQKVSHKVSVI